MLKSSGGTSARIGFGFALFLAIGCGAVGCGGSSHSNPDGSDAKKSDGGAGTGGGTAGSTATAGTDGGAGTGGTAGATAGTDGGAGTGGTAGATAGTDGGAGTGGTAGATAGTDGGAGTGGTAGATAGTDGGAGTGGTAGTDAAAGADGAAGSDGGVADAADAATDASDAAEVNDAGCAVICTVGAKRCGAGGGVQTCTLDANTCPVWGTEATCGDHAACAAAGTSVACACDATTCTAAGQFCSGGNTRTNCAQAANGCFFATAAAVACGVHTTCTGSAGAATCQCNVDPSCANDTTTFCQTTSSKSTCGKDADGCFFVSSTVTCPTHTTCTGLSPTGDCTCDAPPAGCVGSGTATFCSNTGGSVTSCGADAKGCIFIDHSTNCGTHQTCTGADGVGACTCNAPPAICPSGNVGFACSGNSSVHCGLDGQSCVVVDTTTPCTANELCSGTTGQCACLADPAGCSVSGTFCDAGNLTTCSTDAHGCHTVTASAACPSANQTCTGSLPSASCQCNAAPSACVGGAAGSFCTTGTQVTTCTADTQGCVTANPVHNCGPHQSCGGASGSAACACVAPSDASCTGNGTFCSGTGFVSTCVVDGDSCPFVSGTPASCPTNQTCKGTGLGTACSCDNTCTAAQIGTYCLDTLTVASCGNDGNGCHISSGTTTCTGTRTCQEPTPGTGACSCRPPGMVAGTGCLSPNTTLCQGDTVLTCVADGTGCGTWVAGTVCTTANHVCGTKSGVAACQCPENTTGNAFVDADPAVGSDGTSGLFATGLDAPADCRFKTLGKGLSVVTSGGKVVATSAGGSGSFAGETFPLNVGAGVTLTTDDGTHTPMSYIIDFTGAGSAVNLGAGAELQGFMVSNAGGNGSASGISVTSTGGVITHVALEGTGGTVLANGIAVTGAGQVAIDNTTVSGFSTGVALSTTAAGATTLVDSTISNNNAANIAIANGVLTTSSVMSGVTVSGGAGIGILITAAGGSSSTLNGGALTVTGMTGSGLTLAGAAATLNYTSGTVSGNAGGGLTHLSGTSTLGAVTFTGNTGAGISESAGTVSLGATTVQTSTGRGIDMSGGALTIGAATIKSNGTDGLHTTGGTVIINTGAQFTSNGTSGTGTGITSSATSVTINGAAATPISVATNANDGIAISAGKLTANYLTLDGNGTGAAKGAGLKVSNTGVVSLGVSSDAAVLIQNNLANGVNVAGTIAGSAIDMRKAVIKNNTGAGILADLNGGQATITGGTISGNSNIGVNVVRAIPVGAVIQLTLNSVTVGPTNGGSAGVYLHGGTGAVDAIVENSTITGNNAVGLQVDSPSTANQTQATIQNNDVSANAAQGMLFGAHVTLNSFAANSIHNNGGNQIEITAQTQGNGTWDLRSPGFACDANINRVWCYGMVPSGSMAVGLRVSANTTVDAENVTWENSAPSAGRDFALSNGAALVPTVIGGQACAAITTCP